MRSSYTVALVGFSQQESSPLESFLRLAERRPPSYLVQDEVLDAQILIVNADNPQALHLVRHAELPGRVMLIGQTDGGTGWPLQRAPVKLVAVLTELDRIVGAPAVPRNTKASPMQANQPARPISPKPHIKPEFPLTEYRPLPAAPMTLAPSPSARRRSPHTEFQPTRPMHNADQTAPPPPAVAVAPVQPAPIPVRRVAPAPAQRPGVMRMTDFGGLDDMPLPSARAAPSRRSNDSLLHSDQRPAAGAPELPRGEVLLVAESLVEGRALLRRFKKYDFSVDWSRDPTQALLMLKAHPYRLVVIDRLSGELDAFQVCRASKQKKPGGRAPVVFMLAAIAGSMDRMKAGLAGCDAYLSRSVSEADLYKLLAQHRLVNLDAFAKTNMGV